MPISNRVVELFAGVGGFHLAAQKSDWEVIWANQWEPGKNVQHAHDIYKKHFPETPTSNADIASVIKKVPKHDLLVGGFPCQDYSVAATKAQGVQGKKGVLWWDIGRVVEYREPPYILLENVDRLLKSPTAQRGRDFAIMLATLDNLGYSVEWRVINAADYGHVQRRRRVFIFAWKRRGKNMMNEWRARYRKCGDPTEWLRRQGLFASTFASDLFGVGAVELYRSQLPLKLPDEGIDSKVLTAELREQSIPGDSERLFDISEHWMAHKVSPFKKAGLMIEGQVWTSDCKAVYNGPRKVLGDIIQKDVDDAWFYLDGKELKDWKYLKGAKREDRVVKSTGFRFTYSEGALPFPDPLDRPSRTIITGEGGKSPSRFKHVIEDSTGRLRRITPVEAERLNGFPDDWTDVGKIPTNFRYFSMGNALVVPLVRDIMHKINRQSKTY
jgi:DNA (cytosine-5)-methyltransferase 1